jgi:hypothetical protein
MREYVFRDDTGLMRRDDFELLKLVTGNDIVSAFIPPSHTCIKPAHQLHEELEGCSSNLWAIVFEQGDQVWYNPVDSLVRGEPFRDLTKRLESVDF